MFKNLLNFFSFDTNENPTTPRVIIPLAVCPSCDHSVTDHSSRPASYCIHQTQDWVGPEDGLKRLQIIRCRCDFQQEEIYKNLELLGKPFKKIPHFDGNHFRKSRP